MGKKKKRRSKQARGKKVSVQSRGQRELNQLVGRTSPSKSTNRLDEEKRQDKAGGGMRLPNSQTVKTRKTGEY